MNLLILSRPGIRIFQILRRSETAWHALKFYEPIEISVGLYIQVGSISAGLSLASDLKYFIRKYGVSHFFEIRPGIFCTPAIARGLYLDRNLPDNHSDSHRYWLWIRNDGEVMRYCQRPDDITYSGEEGDMGGYIFEITCNEPEYKICKDLILK